MTRESLPQNTNPSQPALPYWRVRALLASARQDLGPDLGGFSAVDVVADNFSGSLPEIRRVLRSIGEMLPLTLDEYFSAAMWRVQSEYSDTAFAELLYVIDLKSIELSGRPLRGD